MTIIPGLTCEKCRYNLWGNLCQKEKLPWSSLWFELCSEHAVHNNQPSASEAILKICCSFECQCPECGVKASEKLWDVLLEIKEKGKTLEQLGLTLPSGVLEKLLDPGIDKRIEDKYRRSRYTATKDDVQRRAEILKAIVPGEAVERTLAKNEDKWFGNVSSR